jgi:hypothetical protein
LPKERDVGQNQDACSSLANLTFWLTMGFLNQESQASWQAICVVSSKIKSDFDSVIKIIYLQTQPNQDGLLFSDV